MQTLSLSSAKAYVADCVANFGATADIEGCGFVTGELIRLNVTVTEADGARIAQQWDVWADESGSLYGEC